MSRPTPVSHRVPAPSGCAGLAAPEPAAAAPSPPRRLHSDELFRAGAVEVEIEHQQQIYRLRRTSLGKLILTK